MNIETLDLRDLRYFVACLDHPNLSTAARSLHVAQPTLSHALHRLEAQLGGPVLIRSRNRRAGIRPTRLGEELAETARDILGRLQRFADERDADGPLRGIIRIASIQSLNLTLLPPVLADLAETAPEVDIVLHTLEADVVDDAVREHRVDLGLVAGALDARFPGVDETPLYDERFVVLAPKDDPITARPRVGLATVAARKLVLPPAEGVTGGIIHAAFGQAGLEPQVRLALASGEALRAMVRAGLGLTILPERYLSPDDPHLTAVDLVRPTLRRRVRLLRTVHAGPDRAVEALIKRLRQARAETPVTVTETP